MSTVHSPAEPPAAPDAPAGPAKRPLIQRLPAPAFVVGYGALIVAIVVFVAMLSSYSSGASSGRGASTTLTEVTETTRTAPEPEPEKQLPYNPAPADQKSVRESVRGYLIADLETGATHTGTSARGTLTELAEQSPTELSGHLSRLLEQNCLDKLELTTQKHMRILFQGFCFSTLPPTTIASAIDTANQLGADALALNSYHPSLGTEMSLRWVQVPSQDKLDVLREDWDDVDFPDGIRRLQFNAYGPDEAYWLYHEDGKEPWFISSETGEAFAEKYGTPR